MDKNILLDYIDACELVEETERDIKRLKQKKCMMVQGNVKGSNPEFPYQAQHFRVAGMAYTYSDDTQLRMEEAILVERKARAEEIKLKVESWMNTIPLRMQRIIRFKFFKKLSWEKVADRMGRNSTGDGIRMEFERFMKEN